MSDYPMLISNKLHSFRNFLTQYYEKLFDKAYRPMNIFIRIKAPA
jgi:hypothetical protein